MAHSLASTKGEMLQKLDEIKSRSSVDHGSIAAQHEALRRATLLKHRRVSTQLKLDMVHRQLSDLRRSVHESDSDHQFYRHQMAELSNELQNLGESLERVERNSFFVRRRMLGSVCGTDGTVGGTNEILLSSSHPAIYSSSENLDNRLRSSIKSGFKSRAMRLMSTPPKLRKKMFFGELRAVASLSSLNLKSTSQQNLNEECAQNDTKPRRGPLKFLGSLVDSQIRRRFWNSTKRTKSAGNILDDKRIDSSIISKERSVLRSSSPVIEMNYYPSSSSENSDEEEEEVAGELKEEFRINEKNDVDETSKQNSNPVKTQIDPSLLAEIEDFEKMAAQFISQNSQRISS